jgi:hypothetical protein
LKLMAYLPDKLVAPVPICVTCHLNLGAVLVFCGSVFRT